MSSRSVIIFPFWIVEFVVYGDLDEQATGTPESTKRLQFQGAG